MMLSKIMVWVYSILITVFFIYSVAWNILRLTHALKFYKNKHPKDLEYYIKRCYGHFDENIPAEEAEEDIQILNDMIDKLKKQVNSQ